MNIGTLSPELARAVEELDEALPTRVSVESQDQTGVVVRVRDVALGERWAPRSAELWFVIPYHYPDAPVYPYYVVGSAPVGGTVPALQVVTWRGMTATQVSLRHTGWDPAHDNVLGCVLQTQAWLRST
jgi:hypothetical protein